MAFAQQIQVVEADFELPIRNPEENSLLIYLLLDLFKAPLLFESSSSSKNGPNSGVGSARRTMCTDACKQREHSGMTHPVSVGVREERSKYANRKRVAITHLVVGQ